LRTAPLPIALLLFLVLTARAGDDVSRGGTFSIYAGGRPAGREEWRLRRSNGSVILTSSARLHRADRVQDLRMSVERDPETGGLLRFSAHGVQGDRERTITLAATNGGLVGEIREGESAEVIRVPNRSGALIIAEPFATPWIAVVERYDRSRGGRQTFPVLYALTGKTGEVTVSLREQEALEIDGVALLTTRLLAVPDVGSPANLWVGENCELLVCARSVDGISAVRGESLTLSQKPGDDPPGPEATTTLRVRLASGEGTLAGSLLRPDDLSGPAPAVLILSGSGPQDRNGNAPGSELRWNYLHSFAAALAGRGIITLRFDDRGVAGSSGAFAEAGFSELLADARSALEYLRSRDDVDPGRVGVIGHSEGALLAAKLAAREPGVAAVALIGAPAEPLDRMLLGQIRARALARGAEEREAARIVADLRAFFEHVRLARSDVLEWKGQVRNVRWIRQHLGIDPEKVYSKIRCPTLVIHGERDLQVPSEHAERVFGMLVSCDREKIVFPGLDHFLMATKGGLQSYGDARRRVAGEALNRLASGMAVRLNRD